MKLFKTASLLVCLLTVWGCSPTGSDSAATATDTNTASSYTTVAGAGVKGPLAGASVTAYLLDTAQVDLKGEAIAIGSTDATAKLDLAITDSMLDRGPFLIEYVGGTELSGEIPAIESLVTVLTSQQLRAGTASYATPLTTLAIEHARQTADKIANNTDPLSSGLAGNNNGTISIEEFIAALDNSATNIKTTLGLGLLDQDIDIFTTSPLLNANTEAQDTIAIRTANEVFAAIVNLLKTELMSDGLAVSGTNLLAALAADFSDGTFDTQSNGDAVAMLNSIDNIAQTFTDDPTQLIVPGTERTVEEINELIYEEAIVTAPEAVDAIAGEALPPAVIAAPVISVYQATPEPSPEPSPEPAPETPVAPLVQITQPGNTSITEGGSIAVSASASDSDGEIAHCRLSSNGTLVRQDASAPYHWGVGSDTNDSMLHNLLAGSYQLDVVCVDNTGLSANDSITIIVTEASVIPEPEPQPLPEPQPEPIAPAVSFSTIAGGLVDGDNLAVELSANDPDGNITYCELSINTILVRRDSSAPYRFGANSGFSDNALTSLAAGSYTLSALCVDDSGLTATATASIDVDNAPTPALSNVHLDWNAPASRTDGSPLLLSDIAAYEIYYYLEGGSEMTINLPATDANGNHVSEYTVMALVAGQYYFSIATIDGNNVVSEFIEPVALLIE